MVKKTFFFAKLAENSYLENVDFVVSSGNKYIWWRFFVHMEIIEV